MGSTQLKLYLVSMAFWVLATLSGAGVVTSLFQLHFFTSFVCACFGAGFILLALAANHVARGRW